MGWHNQKIDRNRWRKVRLKVLERDGYRCQLCGKGGRLEVDHRTPLSQAGKMFDMDNLGALCRPCHFQKSRDENPRTSPSVRAWRDLIRAKLDA